ncbi:hypothetical protein NEDG_01410 [Nematocida displodere]|uniref:Nucleoplasmin-like domain-containing protein n=1 Tax=Nematocida displodere TaxID=1805483 RepID=A0A177EBL8_9MICR|nr:hypothetical protein NEDG_01410 [Nematocida displodere]
MAYHSLTITPENTYAQESIEKDTILKSVSLTPYVNASEKRAAVTATIDDGALITICSLVVGHSESKVLNLPLKKGTKIVLGAEGCNDIDVLFYEVDDLSEEVDGFSEEGLGEKYLALSIEGGQTQTLKETTPIRILNAALKGTPTSERTVLLCGAGGASTPVATFLPGAKETEVLDLLFEANEEVALTAVGPNTIDVLVLRGTGYPEEVLEDAECSNECSAQCSAQGERRKTSPEIHPDDVQVKRIQLPEVVTVPETKTSPETNTVTVPETKTSPETNTEAKTDPETNTETIVDVSVVSEGIGRVIGRKSIISCKYRTILPIPEKEAEEVIPLRKAGEHRVLKYFADKIRGAREGSIMKATVTTAGSVAEYSISVGEIVQSVSC